MAKLVFRNSDEPSIKPQSAKLAKRRSLIKKALIAFYILQTILTLVYIYVKS